MMNSVRSVWGWMDLTKSRRLAIKRTHRCAVRRAPVETLAVATSQEPLRRSAGVGRKA